MNRSLLLLLPFIALALPLRAQDDDGGETPEPPASNSPSSGNDGHINILPLGKDKKKGGGGGGAGAGAEGPSDPSILYLKGVKIVKVYEHHEDIPKKQASYGVLEFPGANQGIATAFYTYKGEGHIMGSICNVVPAAYGASGCGWTTWLTDSPGGRPLCALPPDGIASLGPGAYVQGPTVTGAWLKTQFPEPKLGKVGRDVCLLKPHKKYYCNITAQAWDGDKWTLSQRPGLNGGTCTALKAYSPLDTFAAADHFHGDD